MASTTTAKGKIALITGITGQVCYKCFFFDDLEKNIPLKKHLEFLFIYNYDYLYFFDYMHIILQMLFYVAYI